ncbi:MAG: hypothetical protein DRJ44_03095 [Thermoprotei archaeon]|nr:MAG: hypothetical protein B6U96_03670 [Archaeoglobales archaeon ex4484_92]RLE76981.1 MAG: hypothetical protein DRJ44_03095 [Thermoprotei archaeon]
MLTIASKRVFTMDFAEIVASPAFAFLLSFATAISIYILGKKLAPAFSPNKDKIAPYACGEYFPPEKVPMRIIFFQYAVLFLIFDIVSMLVVFSMGLPYWDPVRLNVIHLVFIYILTALLALYILGRRIEYGIYRKIS